MIVRDIGILFRTHVVGEAIFDTAGVHKTDF